MNDNQRKMTKSQVPIAAVLVRGDDIHVGLVRNISTNGAMLDCACNIRPGDAIVVEIEGYMPIEARVAWSISPRYGLSFSTPLVEMGSPFYAILPFRGLTQRKCTAG